MIIGSKIYNFKFKLSENACIAIRINWHNYCSFKAKANLEVEMERDIVDYLLDHMVKRGVDIDILKGLIREVGNIAINTSYISLKIVNERLEYLGWGKDVLDEKGLQLILLLLEDSGLIKVKWQALH